MLRKRGLTVLLVIFVAVLVFTTGCANNGSTATTDANAATATAAQTTASTQATAAATAAPGEPMLSSEMPEPVEFSYLAPIWGPATTEIYSKFADDFFAAANVKIDAVFVPFTEYDTKFPTMVMAGNIPDVFWNNGKEDSIANDLISQGAMLRLNDLLDKYADVKAQYPDFIWELATSSDGSIYGMPSQLVSPFVPFPIMIRKDLFDKYDQPIPTTVDELTESIKIIQQNEPGMYGLTTDYYDPWAFQNLGVAFGYAFNNWVPDPDDPNPDNPATIVPPFMGTGFVDFFRYMNQLRNDGVLDPDMGIVQNAGGHDKFITGKCVAEIGGATYFSTATIIKQLKQVDPSYEAVLIQPIMGTAQLTGCTVLNSVLKVVSLSSKAEDKADDIFKAFNWMATDEGYDMLRWGVLNKTYLKVDDGSDGSVYNNDLYVSLPDEERESGYLADNVKLWRIFINYDREFAFDWRSDYIKTLRITRELGLTDSVAQDITDMRKEMLHEAAANAIPDYRKGTYSEKLVQSYSTLVAQYITPMRDQLLIAETFDMAVYEKAVNDFLANGGQEIIDEVNANLADKSRPEIPPFVEIDFDDYGTITDKDINPQDYYPLVE